MWSLDASRVRLRLRAEARAGYGRGGRSWDDVAARAEDFVEREETIRKKKRGRKKKKANTNAELSLLRAQLPRAARRRIMELVG